MVTVINSAPPTYYGLSSDSKPTTNIQNGSMFVEIDTGVVSLFNQEGSAWVEQFSFQA